MCLLLALFLKEVAHLGSIRPVPLPGEGEREVGDGMGYQGCFLAQPASFLGEPYQASLLGGGVWGRQCPSFCAAKGGGGHWVTGVVGVVGVVGVCGELW